MVNIVDAKILSRSLLLVPVDLLSEHHIGVSQRIGVQEGHVFRSLHLLR